MLASIRSCWTVLLAWAILLELCILDDIFDYLHRPGLKTNKKKVDMHSALFLMSSQQQSYISLYPMIHELHTAEFSCKTCARQDICLYVHSETAKALWWGTEGLFDSYSGWGCLVCQIPSEGLFHWVCSLCIALRLQEGEPKQAVCVLTEDQSLQLLTVPAEHSFRLTIVTSYSANSSCTIHTCAQAQRDRVSGAVAQTEGVVQYKW